MKIAVEKFFPMSDCLVMSAAVADYGPEKVLPRKIKKRKSPLILKLKRNPDILSSIARKKRNNIVIGFALESEDLLKSAREKLDKKNLDYIVATSINTKNPPFGDRKIRALIVPKFGKTESFVSDKKTLSKFILDKIEMVTYPYSDCK